MAAGGALLALISMLAILWPWLLAWPLAGLGLWIALALLLRSARLFREGRTGAALTSDSANGEGENGQDR